MLSLSLSLSQCKFQIKLIRTFTAGLPNISLSNSLVAPSTRKYVSILWEIDNI